jgi:hypothetical protein
MQERYSDSIVCDSSSLISLTESCLLGVLEQLAEGRRGGFYISNEVKNECIDKPINMRSHALTAVRLKDALRRGAIKLFERSDGGMVNDVAWVANNIFHIHEKPLRIIHLGEAGMIATAMMMGTGNILIDERTTRMIVESPRKLREHLEKEFGRKVVVNEDYLEKFRRIAEKLVIIRSSELVMIAYERGYFKRFGKLEKKTVESALYGLKFNGCGISFSEINEFCNTIR